MGVKRINARRLLAANKILRLAAACYNLKKWLKFIAPKTNIEILGMLKTKTGEFFVRIKTAFLQFIIKENEEFNFLPSADAFSKTKKQAP